MDLKQIRTGTTAANAPRPMLAEITLVMVQLSYDEFVLFCNQPAVKERKVNYEKLEIRDRINSIYISIKNRMRSRTGNEGLEQYDAMMERVCSICDSQQKLVETAHAKYRAAIVQSLPWQWQMPLIHGALSFYFMYNAGQAAQMLSGGRCGSAVIDGILDLMDGLLQKYEIPEWKPLQDSLQREWVQPVIDGVIAAAATEHMRQETTPVSVPVRRNADTEDLKRRLDRIMEAHIV